MSDGRARLSGCGYKKRAREKRGREEKLLSQMPTVQQLFSKVKPVNEGGSIAIKSGVQSTSHVVPDSSDDINASTDSESRDAHPNNDREIEGQRDLEVMVAEDGERAETSGMREVLPCVIPNVYLLENYKDPVLWTINSSTRDFFCHNKISQDISK